MNQELSLTQFILITVDSTREKHSPPVYTVMNEIMYGEGSFLWLTTLEPVEPEWTNEVKVL